FHLPGEVVGLDGMLEGRHVSTALAMEDSEVCVIRLSQIDHVASHLPPLQHQMRRLMRRELGRSYQMLASLGGMRSERRLAAFLLSLSQRYAAVGHATAEFALGRAYQMLASLGGMRSGQRLAAFLLNLSQRYAALGYSSTEFVLRMSREEIGNYLGLTLETASRLFSRFAREGLIKINQREVRLLDVPTLKQMLGQDAC